MLRTKLGLLGLCAVVLGMMAMSASSAQAALSWLILDSKGVATELKAALVGETDSSHLVLLTTISKGTLMVSIVCTGFSLNGVNLETGGTLTTGGKVVFTGCAAYTGTFTTPPLSNVLKTTLQSECTISTAGAAAGTIETNKGKGKLVLNGAGEVLTEVAPETGTEFVKILAKGTCVLPEENPVKGTLFLKDCLGQALTHAVKHLVEEGPGSALTLGVNAATLLGSGWIKLGGTHAGLAWSAMDA